MLDKFTQSYLPARILIFVGIFGIAMTPSDLGERLPSWLTTIAVASLFLLIGIVMAMSVNYHVTLDWYWGDIIALIGLVARIVYRNAGSEAETAVMLANMVFWAGNFLLIKNYAEELEEVRHGR